MIKHLKSFLFVPGDNPDRIRKAVGSQADAVIIDLEDSVAAGAKSLALAGLGDARSILRSAGKSCVVRINADAISSERELLATIDWRFDAVMLPKVESPASLMMASDLLSRRNRDAGQAATSIIALVESARGLLAAAHIAAVPCVSGLALGTEDFSLDMGAHPTPDLLELPVRQIALAARAHGIAAIALPVSIAEFRDTERIRQAALRAAAVGCSGALCIHPNQVAAVNAAFAPSPAALDEARSILTAWAEAQAIGVAVARLGGLMIDAPVVARAQQTLARAGEAV